MIVAYTNTIKKPIASLREQAKIGEIEDIIFDGDFKIQAFTLTPTFLNFSGKKIVSNIDVIELVKEALIIKDDEAIMPISDLSRINKLYKAKFYGINQKVITENGQSVGSVFDYLIDSTTLSITKIYIKKLFSELVIPVSKITKIKGKTITVKDRFETVNVANFASAENYSIS
jgi:sporulation protein YlmC with PRC-barrel domain